MAQFHASRLVELRQERQTLDALLDAAVVRFARVEEEVNARMKLASPEQVRDLMAERDRVEDALGIADLLNRIDAVQQQMAELTQDPAG